jgi:16S rRNA (guanine527-N7)-methyltransferase
MPDSLVTRVPRETLDRLNIFVDLLTRWNAAINLVARADLASVWTRHVDDSLQLVLLLTPPPSRAIDLGSGAGFPGLILAIATGIHVDLVESDRRKAAFLSEAIRRTEASASVHATRAETIVLAPAPLVTARALAPLSKLLTLSARLLAPDGRCLFLKGRGVAAELTDAQRQWQMTCRQIPSRTTQEAVILDIGDLRAR